MKKIFFWRKLKKNIGEVGKRSGRIIKPVEEMAGQLEKMGRLGGQLFVMRAG